MALAGLMLWAAACSSSGPEADRLGTARAAVGEPQDGFPNWDERAIHLWTNRARCDPRADLADCSVCAEKDCYTPKPPLRFSYELTRAARFHSANQTSCGAMSHDSRCTLVPDIADLYTPGSCDGSASCACVGGGPPCDCESPGACTSTWSRIVMFGASGSGENVAGGGPGNPTNTFYRWLHEEYDHPDNCAFDYGPPTNGHRWNILMNSGPGLGVGCTGSYCTQDFGGPAASASKLVVGVHHPETGVAIDFRAHWYDSVGNPPQQAMVNVGGSCHTMSVERGVEASNATYLLAGHGVSGCTNYYFVFKDSSGNWVTYPESGSFGINCTEDWDPSTRPDMDATCDCTPECTDKECGPDGCGGSCGTCPGTLACGADGQCGCEAGLEPCGTECVNTQSDVDHCGGCESPCTAPQVCASGSCADSCAAGQTDCDGSCADLDSDPTHCGDCAITCSPGASCESGACTCAGGLLDCPGVGCTDVATDPLNCGECGRECTGCSQGRCPGDATDGGLVGAGADDGTVRGGCASAPGGDGAFFVVVFALFCLAAGRGRRR